MNLKEYDQWQDGINNVRYGAISFSYDNLMSALKPGHPMEILDSILATIFFDVQAGKEPPREKLEETLEGFKAFKETFKVREMSRPIKDLTDYLEHTK